MMYTLKSACFSRETPPLCRYNLRREIDQHESPVHLHGTLICIGVNPSDADANKDDPTIRKVAGFTVRLGHRCFVMLNKFARIATDVNDLKRLNLPDAVGLDNDCELACAMSGADTLLFAWGPLAKLPVHLRARWRRVWQIAQDLKKTPFCIGTAKDGHPRHPLMVSYDTPVVPWSPPAWSVTT